MPAQETQQNQRRLQHAQVNIPISHTVSVHQPLHTALPHDSPNGEPSPVAKGLPAPCSGGVPLASTQSMRAAALPPSTLGGADCAAQHAPMPAWRPTTGRRHELAASARQLRHYALHLGAAETLPPTMLLAPLAVRRAVCCDSIVRQAYEGPRCISNATEVEWVESTSLAGD